MGIVFPDDGALIGRDGRTQERIFVIGPLLK
jgi:hypothetical protein